MVGGNVIVEVEGVKQSVLIAAVLTHHLEELRALACHSDRGGESEFGVFQRNRPKTVIHEL